MGNSEHQSYAASVTADAREFDLLRPHRRSRITVRPALISELKAAFAFAARHVAGGVSRSPMAFNAIRRNPNNLFLFIHRDRLIGIWAMLMLTREGRDRLLDGSFPYADPDPALLTTAMLRPAAIYNWALVTPGFAAEGIARMSVLLSAPRYRHADLYARPITPAAKRLQLRRGYSPVEGHPDGLYHYRRLANRS